MTFAEAIMNSIKSRCGFACLWMVFSFIVMIFPGVPPKLHSQVPPTENQTPDHKDSEQKDKAVDHRFDLSLPAVSLKSLPKNILIDQTKFWTTPFHMTRSQWQWTVPLTFVGASLLASDTAIEKHVPTSHTTASRAVTASNAGVAALAGVGAGMFLWGHATHADEPREAGLLAGEAGIDAFLDTEAFKYIFGRERPFTGDGKGKFFQGGTSFPSEHAAVSWAIASVLAHEYPGPLTQLLVYGAATGVSAARLIGQQHFATDVIAGSALGWYMGRQVFRAHSRYSSAELARWGTFTRGEEDTAHQPRNMASPFVPLDSWVYPAMERLVALGYIESGFLGMRPWSRMECARLLVKEADEALQNESAENTNAGRIYDALRAEFADEIARFGGETNLGVSVDSLYTRLMGISGTPLQDGLHFGQTIVNDYGRPYSEGFNNITGASGHAVAGPLSFYVRAEYQHAPSIPALSASAAQTIQGVDGLPSAPPMSPTPAVNRVTLLEGYVGVQLNNWQFTFGKQSAWWGPDQSGAMLFSSNAAPILMLRINRVSPFRLPILGSIRIDYMVGRLTGYHWVFGVNTGFVGSWTQTLSNQPFIMGEKLSFKPTPNLELGFSSTALFAGPGVPATAHKLVQAMFSTGNGLPGSSGDAGDRRGGFDVTYTFPRLNGLTLYADAFTDDEPNPWLAWNKSALTSGLYLSRVPGIPNLDLRVEGIYTDPPGGSATVQHGFFYSNSRFKSGYTNDGYLIGSWIGRQGQGVQAWTTYWLNPRSNVQLSFRHQKVSQQFIPDGGTLTDVGVSGEYWFRHNLGVSAWVQHERWLFPVIQPNASQNVTAAVEFLFQPKKLFPRPTSAKQP
jgi:membrane-associated phospholipid phosphatase